MRMREYRNIVALLEALLILGIPFVRINGESALRFDIPTLRLHLFGTTIWLQEFFIVLLATIAFLLAVILLTNLLGRVWCGWLCPQTVLLDLRRFLSRGKDRLDGIISHVFSILLSLVVSASLIWYFVPPYDFFTIILGQAEGPVVLWFFVIQAAIIYLDLQFLGRGFCKTICPYAKLQSTLFDKNTLVIEFDKDRAAQCMGCDKCVRVCPTGIDIKKGLQMECIACAECIDACVSMTRPRGLDAFVRYTFGAGKLVRPKVVVLGALAVAFVLFALYRISTIPPFAFSVTRSGELYRVTEKGEVVNIYTLTIRNLGERDTNLTVSLASPDKIRVMGPGLIAVGAGQIVRQNIVLLSSERETKRRAVVFTLKDHGGYEVKQEAVFFSP